MLYLKNDWILNLLHRIVVLIKKTEESVYQYFEFSKGFTSLLLTRQKLSKAQLKGRNNDNRLQTHSSLRQDSHRLRQCKGLSLHQQSFCIITFIKLSTIHPCPLCHSFDIADTFSFMMAMKKNIAIIAVLVISFVTSYILCGTEQNDAGIDSIKIEEYSAVLENRVSLDSVAGTYSGVLPPDVETTLTLNADGTYLLIRPFKEKQNERKKLRGTFQVLDGNILMLVHPSSGDNIFYKVRDGNHIVLIDSFGNEPKKEVRKNYILKKK